MGLLSGNALKTLLFDPPDEASRLVITPLLSAGQLKPDAASVDLRLSSHFRAARRTNLAFSDPLLSGDSDEALDRHYVQFGRSFVLHPRHFVIGMVLEYLRIPLHCGAYVVGRSTWGRRGLVIATAMGIHPGFAGQLALELTNLGEVPILLYPGTRVAQLFLHTLDGGAVSGPAASVFAGSLDPQLGTFHADEVETLIRNLATVEVSART